MLNNEMELTSFAGFVQLPKFRGDEKEVSDAKSNK